VSKVGKLVLVVVVVAAVHVAVARLSPQPYMVSLRLFSVGPIHFDLVNMRNAGAAFSLFAEQTSLRVLKPLIASFAAVCLAVLFLSLVERQHTLQLIALGCIVSPSFVGVGEQVLRGYRLDYFDLGFGPYHFRAFNAADLAGLCGWFLLYGLVILRFFRRVPETSDAVPEMGARDPFFEKRKPLRVLLGTLAVVGTPMVLAQFVSLVASAVLPPAAPEDVFARTQAPDPLSALLYFFLNLFTLVLVLVTWRMIPKRPIDVLVLRSFHADQAGWSVVKDLRKALRPRLRMTGVVDPKESRRLVYLLYWILMPFVFGIGDMGRVNAFRHNIFLTENWREDLRRQFSAVRYAVFDCRELTSNVAWELGTALEILTPPRVFFLVQNGVAALQEELRTYQLQASLDPAHCFAVADSGRLAQTLLSESPEA
jgi:signal peptidase II